MIWKSLERVKVVDLRCAQHEAIEKLVVVELPGCYPIGLRADRHDHL